MLLLLYLVACTVPRMESWMLQDELIEAVSDDLGLRQEMEKWIRLFYPQDEIIYPTEWMESSQRSLFSEVADSILGEERSDWWQHNKVFRHFGSSNLGDLNNPISDDEAPKNVRAEDDLEPLAAEFMRKYGDFLSDYASVLNRRREFQNDPERIDEGFIWGIGYALNSPTRSTNIDQRLNFFKCHPGSLTSKYILEVCSKSMSLSLAKTLSRVMVLRINKALFDVGFVLGQKRGELKSFSIANKICNRKERKEVLAALAEVAEDSVDGFGDGLISHLSRIIDFGKSEDLQNHVKYHIEQRIRSSRTREGKRKSKEINYSRNSDDSLGSGFDGRGGDVQIKELQVEEDIREDGVHVTSRATRHVENRLLTPFEHKEISNFARAHAKKTIDPVIEIMKFIICDLKQEATDSAKDIIATNKFSTPSNRLSVFLPDFLDVYMKTVLSQIEISIRPENEIHDENGCLIYKKGKSSISWGKDKKIKNLSSFIDRAAFTRELKSYVDLKMKIYDSFCIHEDVVEISKDLGESIELIEFSLLQFSMLDKTKPCKESNKPENVNYVRDYFCDKIDAISIMNSFTWQWHRILAALYQPITDLDIDYLRDRSDDRNKKGKLRFVTRHHQGKSRGTMLRKWFSRKIKRKYSQFSQESLHNFSNLLTVHSYIINGTLPNLFFDISKKDLKLDKSKTKIIPNVVNMPQPGIAWGHNISRLTGESSVQMYYDIFHGGLDRNNLEHKDVRDNISKVILLRRAKEISDRTRHKSRMISLITCWKATRLLELGVIGKSAVLSTVGKWKLKRKSELKLERRLKRKLKRKLERKLERKRRRSVDDKSNPLEGHPFIRATCGNEKCGFTNDNPKFEINFLTEQIIYVCPKCHYDSKIILKLPAVKLPRIRFR
jgi:hypothetical protein